MWLPDSSILIPEAHGLVDYSDPVNWSHPLNRGLVSWYLALPDWMGGNTWFDLCGRHHGQLANMTPADAWQASSMSGGWGALGFDASSAQWVVVSSTGSILATLSKSTVVCDFHFNAAESAGNGGPIWTERTSATPIWKLQVGRAVAAGGNKLNFVHRDDLGTLTGLASSSVITQQDTMGALVKNGNAVTFYKNGSSDGTGTINGTDSVTASDVVIGCDLQNTAGSRFDGPIRSIRIYNRDLSATEVRDLYNLSRQHYPGLLNRVQLPYYAPQAGGFIDNTSPILRHIMGAAL